MTATQDFNAIFDTVAFMRRATAGDRPLAVVLAGHNGSGKSTVWFDHLVDEIKAPLFNADRMLASVLPPPDEQGHLTPWAQALRDADERWMAICQKGVEGFTAQARAAGASFAVETVFSHWQRRDDGTYESKIDLIRELQAVGYFVLLIFVGLSHPGLSMTRVASRVANGGHDVLPAKVVKRFRRTQQAIRHAVPVADGAILLDNSRHQGDAFTMCYASMGDDVLFDIRDTGDMPWDLTGWLDVVVPTPTEGVLRPFTATGCANP